MAFLPKDGVSNWNPGVPSGSLKQKLTPNAKDNPDSLSPTNEQKQFVGKKGAQSEPLGKRGRNF